MPALPTILFSSFQSGADPQRQSWARFREQVNTSSNAILTAGRHESTGSQMSSLPVASNAEGESGIWRLLAPNNRELGRSSFLYGSFSAAHNHVLRMRGVETLAVSTVTGPIAQSFGWFIALRGVPVMTCTKWFGSAAASNEAARSALAAFSEAVVTSSPLRSTSSGRRTNRTPRVGTQAEW